MAGHSVMVNASKFLNIPRFKPENFEHNKQIYKQVKEIALRKGCTTSQLALAWILHKGDDICPIPGTTKIDNLNENIEAISVKLTTDEMMQLQSCAAEDMVKAKGTHSCGRLG
ncbi:hypothetical protein KY284_037293 [Solanum tuberosum]|nr:hypothetical protein KY284_037293 [Solanum tuberosum]